VASEGGGITPVGQIPGLAGSCQWQRPPIPHGVGPSGRRIPRPERL